ncbi:MAG: TraB/GumN family protein [Paludibacteraceae bacterium]|nr:TraB/GumN family protein [Paludibacteraceae bacterium]
MQAQLLWKISGKGLKNSSYIFATHPYVANTFLNNSDDLIKYFKQTKKVVCEFESGDFEGLKTIQENAFLSSGKSVISSINKDDFEIAATFFTQQAGFSLESVAALKPQYITALYHEQLARSIPGNSDGIFSDAWFQWYAAENNKAISGLESIEVYLKYENDTNSLEKQSARIIEMAKGHKAHKTEFIRQIELYKNGQTDSLYYSKSLTGSICFDMSERNQKRALVIENEAREHSCFITVDAKSLPGEAGLLNILKSKGFTITAVKF